MLGVAVCIHYCSADITPAPKSYISSSRPCLNSAPSPALRHRVALHREHIPRCEVKEALGKYIDWLGNANHDTNQYENNVNIHPPINHANLPTLPTQASVECTTWNK